jgi:hypothetical protein
VVELVAVTARVLGEQVPVHAEREAGIGMPPASARQIVVAFASAAAPLPGVPVAAGLQRPWAAAMSTIWVNVEQTQLVTASSQRLLHDTRRGTPASSCSCPAAIHAIPARRHGAGAELPGRLS